MRDSNINNYFTSVWQTLLFSKMIQIVAAISSVSGKVHQTAFNPAKCRSHASGTSRTTCRKTITKTLSFIFAMPCRWEVTTMVIPAGTKLREMTQNAYSPICSNSFLPEKIVSSGCGNSRNTRDATNISPVESMMANLTVSCMRCFCPAPKL